MSFWASLTTYAHKDDNFTTFCNVSGVPGEHPRAFLEPVHEVLVRTQGVITQDVVDEAERKVARLDAEDYPGAHAVARWLRQNVGQTLKGERGRYFSY